MQNNSISRSSSICTCEGIIVGSFSGSEIDHNDYGFQNNDQLGKDSIKNEAIDSHKEWESNCIKHKILRIFCCR